MLTYLEWLDSLTRIYEHPRIKGAWVLVVGNHSEIWYSERNAMTALQRYRDILIAILCPDKLDPQSLEMQLALAVLRGDRAAAKALRDLLGESDGDSV